MSYLNILAILKHKKLYKEGHTLSESIQFLEKNNFYITNVVSNDRTNNEYNIFLSVEL